MVRFTVLYGSQTGGAEEVAHRVARDATRRCFSDVSASALDSYDRSLLVNEDLVVFIVATTGDGDPPDNMRQFWRFLLRKGLPARCLSSLSFAVFGLGDSSYNKYNYLAKKLRNRLVQLGATEAAQRGFGDDQSTYGLEGDLDKWLGEILWPQLLLKYPLPEGFVVHDSPQLFEPLHPVGTLLVSAVPETAPGPTVENAITKQAALSTRKGVLGSLRPAGCYDTPPLVGTCKVNHRLTALDWEQDVRHVELQVEGCPAYKPGDIAVVYPENSLSEQEFAALCELLGLQADACISGLRLPHAPAKVSVRDLFSLYLDVLGTPRRRFFEACYFFTQHEEEKEKMLELCSTEGSDLFHAYCKKERKSYWDVLCGGDFLTCKPPLEYLVEMLPKLEPREYSIASSRAAHGEDKVHLTVAVLSFLTPWGRKKTGVASHWIQGGLAEGDKVILFIKRGVLILPPLQTGTGLAEETASPHPPLPPPMILVGPGTGVAPMRALLNARPAPGSRLYFGCRSSTKDYYYEQEWVALVERGALGAMRTAFSRDTPGRKVYVQHLIKEDTEYVNDVLVNQNGFCYISGSANKMPAEVREAIVEAITKEHDESFAKAFVKQMEHTGKLKIESWS